MIAAMAMFACDCLAVAAMFARDCMAAALMSERWCLLGIWMAAVVMFAWDCIWQQQDTAWLFASFGVACDLLYGDGSNGGACMWLHDSSSDVCVRLACDLLGLELAAVGYLQVAAW